MGKGGKLAILHNALLIEMVGKYIGNEKVWIGGSDIKEEGKWRWIDGSEMSWTNWDKNEPGKDKENCLLMIDGKWHDALCGDKHRFLCQLKAKKVCETVLE